MRPFLGKEYQQAVLTKNNLAIQSFNLLMDRAVKAKALECPIPINDIRAMFSLPPYLDERGLMYLDDPKEDREGDRELSDLEILGIWQQVLAAGAEQNISAVVIAGEYPELYQLAVSKGAPAVGE